MFSKSILFLVKRRLLFAIAIAYPALALGHLAGITDTSIQMGYSKVKVVYTLPQDSLAELYVDQEVSVIPLDEVAQRLAKGFEISNNETACGIHDISYREIERVKAIQVTAYHACDSELDRVDIRYLLFIDRFENHENFTRIAMAGKYLSLVLSADRGATQVPVKETLQQWGVTLTDDFVDDPNESFGLDSQPNYFPLGIEHILLGFDHLLFLFALLLLPLQFRQLIIMVTSFTVAHSITLAVAVFELVSLPVLWVEAVIALSIVYVGIENLVELKGLDAGRLKQALWKRRVVVTFCFGLIHGFGFSYVLKEIGLGEQLASALLFFNLGVEVGQLLAVMLVFPLLVWLFKRWPSLLFSKVCSGLVILLGGFWLIERLMAIGS